MPDDKDQLLELLEQWHESARRGSPLAVEQLCHDCPELAPALRDQIAAFLWMQDLADAVQAPTTPMVSHTDCRKIAGYEILGELGRGGMGVVYKARQLALSRLVALKLLASDHATDEVRERFLGEAEAIAALNHPGIVAVFDTGVHEGSQFISLEFCEGGSLAELLAGNPLPPREAARFAEQIARAVQAAHDAGIIHRDLKPSNVLLRTAEGTDAAWQPKVTDFGLARRAELTQGLTVTGAVLGTPSYMPPEQAQGTREIGPRADVYALGAILYEMLTGRPPHRAATTAETICQVVHDEPIRPTRLVPGVPRDLETACLKCLEKDPTRRYVSAAAFAEDLRRWQANEPITARPIGPIERTRRWIVRNPAWAALLAVSTLALLLLLGGGFWFSAKLGEARTEGRAAAAEAREAQAREEAAARLADSRRFFTLLSQARERIALPEPGWTWQALSELDSAAALPDAADKLVELRTEAARCLGAVDVRQIATLGKGTTAYSVAWHPEGKMLALGDRAGSWVRCSVWLVHPDEPDKARPLSFTTWPIKRKSDTVPDQVNHLVFSPHGRWLVAGMRSGSLVRWDLTQANPSAVSWQAHTHEVNSVHFSADGTSLYSAAQHSIKRWDVPTWKQATAIQPKGFSSGLQRLVNTDEGSVAYLDDDLHLLSANTLQQTRSPIPVAKDEGYCRFVLAGRTLLMGAGSVIRTFDLETREFSQELTRPLRPSSYDGIISDLALHPDGDLILSACQQAGHVRLWQRGEGREVAHLVIGGGTCQVAFRPDGRRFVVTAEKETRLYEISDAVQSAIGTNANPLCALALHPNGRSLAIVAPKSQKGAEAETWLWPADHLTTRPLACIEMGLTHPDYLPQQIALTPDGQRLLYSHAHPELSGIGQRGLFGGRTPQLGGMKQWDGFATAPDSRLWVASEDRVLAFDIATAKHSAVYQNGRAAFTGRGQLYSVATGRRWVVVGARDGTLHVLAPGTGSLASTNVVQLGTVPVRAVALSAHETLALAGDDAGVLHRGVLSHEGKVTISDRVAAHRDRVVTVALARTGLAVSGGRDGIVRLFDAREGLRPLLSLKLGRPVLGLGLFPDGTRLAVLLDGERAVRLWRLDRLRKQCERIGLGEGLDVLGMTPAFANIPAHVPSVDQPTESNGLRAEIFADAHQTQLTRVRYDTKVDFVRPADDMRLDPTVNDLFTSARWTGWLKAPKPGRYVIALEYDRRARLWLDGVLMADGWHDTGKNRLEVEVNLSDNLHDLRIDYRHFNGPSRLRLLWTPPGGGEEVVPASALRFAATR